ncbi:hypothetical protein [Treponema sp. R6D11]
MYNFKTLRIISLILGFALVTFGCTKKNQTADLSDVKISAKTVSKGILVTFSNYSSIPPEIDNLKVVFHDWGKDGEPDWGDMDTLETFIYFHDYFRESFCENAIEQVRKTGKVTFPFVKKDHIYTIRALFISGEDIIKRINTKCVADKGVYLNENITLDLNSDNTGVTLSDKPTFTPNVKSGIQKMSYNIVICTEDNWHAIASDKTDDLFWNFEPKFSEYLKEKNVTTDDYQSYAGVNLNIIYNKISWIMESVKSPIFTYSFK